MKATKWVKVQIVEYRSIYVEVLDASKEDMEQEASEYAFECGSSGWEIDEVNVQEISDTEPDDKECRRWDIDKFKMDASDKEDK